MLIKYDTFPLTQYENYHCNMEPIAKKLQGELHSLASMRSLRDPACMGSDTCHMLSSLSAGPCWPHRCVGFELTHVERSRDCPDPVSSGPGGTGRSGGAVKE